MTDYGHNLLFGTFVTPSAQGASNVIDLAVTADRAGLDLVTFQDHPYQPTFLDTPTLIAYAAARTERIHLSANVANLPLRPPAVLARAAASLDILSGGRLELGIGAGYYWDPIAAMGGRRPRPRSPSTRSARVSRSSATSGTPTPAAASSGTASTTRSTAPSAAPSPRTTSTSGSAPTSPRCSRSPAPPGTAGSPRWRACRRPGSLPEANDRIDQAAAAAGRPPAAVRRLMNFMNVDFSPIGHGSLTGPPEEWVNQLTTLALEHGITAFLIGGDDLDLTEKFAAEVAPAVRESVAKERA